jgi:hypothetical protein
MAKGKNNGSYPYHRVKLPFSSLKVDGRTGRKRIKVRVPMSDGTTDQVMDFPLDQLAFLRIGSVEFYRRRRLESKK